jgi:predicted NodU family carbamoyl transferase
VKNDPAFPVRAIQFCLEEGGITAADLDYVVFHEKPLIKFWSASLLPRFITGRRPGAYFSRERSAG